MEMRVGEEFRSSKCCDHLHFSKGDGSVAHPCSLCVGTVRGHEQAALEVFF